MALPFTQAQYAALTAAIAEGARVVKYEDREVTYRSLEDMIKLSLLMAKALGLATGAPGRKVMAHNKGLGPTPSGNANPWEVC